MTRFLSGANKIAVARYQPDGTCIADAGAIPGQAKSAKTGSLSSGPLI